MLRHTETEADAQTQSYTPVPRRDRMTDAHIEDFLDHQGAPLIGTMSYEERQQLRAETRQHILSTVAAHEELGSSHEEAVELALRSMSAATVAAPETVTSSVNTTQSRRGFVGRSLRPAISAFGMSTIASFALLAASKNSTGTEVAIVLTPILGVFPFVAGAALGARNVRKPLSSLLLAQLLLYLPTTLGLVLLISSEGRTYIDPSVFFFTAVYTAVTTLFGGAGIQAGAWVRDRLSRPGRKHK